MPRTLNPLEYLAQQLTTSFMALETAHECICDLERLALFVSDELAGFPVDELFPELASHLDHCESCQLIYEELSRIASQALFNLE
jgi:hypothetical protein